MDCSRFPALVYLLVLHLAHLPLPCCDGDNLVGASSAGRTCEVSLAVSDAGWDVDFVLLGLDPPDDTDEEPFDSTPESPELPFLIRASIPNELRANTAVASATDLPAVETRAILDAAVRSASWVGFSSDGGFFAPGSLRVMIGVATC